MFVGREGEGRLFPKLAEAAYEGEQLEPCATACCSALVILEASGDEAGPSRQSLLCGWRPRGCCLAESVAGHRLCRGLEWRGLMQRSGLIKGGAYRRGSGSRGRLRLCSREGHVKALAVCRRRQSSRRRAGGPMGGPRAWRQLLPGRPCVPRSEQLGYVIGRLHRHACASFGRP